jgi:hypothetical protein
MSITILGKPLTSRRNAAEVFRSLEDEAHKNIKRQKLFYYENDDEQLNANIYKCRNCQRAMKNGDEKTKEKATRNMSRLQSEAITIISKNGKISHQQMALLGLTEEKILFEMAYRNELADWVELESDESLLVREYLEELASNGDRIDYYPLEKMKDQMGVLREDESKNKALSGSFLKTKQIQDKISNLQAQIDEERRRTSELKSKPENLCYYIFCERHSRDYLDIFAGNIQGQSRYYLKIMVRIIIHFYNGIHRNDIQASNNHREAMRKAKTYHPKKSISADDKRELIQTGKAYGMKQEEVAEELHCSLPTVKRYWNQEK